MGARQIALLVERIRTHRGIMQLENTRLVRGSGDPSLPLLSHVPHGAGQCLQIIDKLHQRDQSGRYVRRSASELASAIRALGGIATITSCVLRIRKNIAARLERELGVACGRDDVIQNNEQGYSLREWITVRDGTSPPKLPVEPAAAAVRPTKRPRRKSLLLGASG